MASKLELFSHKAGVCILDMQEKLATAMPEKVIKGTLRNCLNLIESARILGLPILVTEQSPEALGRSLPVVAESVFRLPSEQVFFAAKDRFSCVGIKTVDAWIKKTGRGQWIVAGMETHVCVYQSVRGLTDAGYWVHVPRDAVVSRSMANWEIGLQLIEQCEAVITSTETVIFDMLKQTGTEGFEILSRIIK